MKQIKFKPFLQSPYAAALAASILSIISIIWSFQNHAILNYADAQSHINIAKRVTGSLTPGLSQLGGIWLPLPHILMAPFAINEFLYRTGLAGSIVSSAAFVFAVFEIFQLTKRVTKSSVAAQVAAIIVMFNPNILYLATTPLDELVLFATASASLNYFFAYILEDDMTGLIAAAFFAFLATLARYDGWALVLSEVVVVWIHTYIKDKSFKKAEGITLMYSMLAFLGVTLWLLWNKLIFGNFLYFANSEYSSKTQQMWFYARGYLPTYKNLPLSIVYYVVDAWSTLGPVVCIAGAIGIVLFIVLAVKTALKYKRNIIEEVLPLLLLFPFIFYTTALYLGQASIMLPQFGKPWDQWDISNVRYGIQMALPLSIFAAFFVSKFKKYFIHFILIALVLVQYGITLLTGQVISYQDGTIGLSSAALAEGPDAPAVENYMQSHYTGGLVLMDDYHRPISPAASGIPMSSFINIGNKPYWQESIDNPASVPEWIIVQQANTDSVWTSITKKQILYDYFATVFVSGNIWVYKKRNVPNTPGFIKKQGQNLIENGQSFNFYGANMYDLLAMPIPETKNMLDDASKEGITVIRFWGFNKQGLMSPTDFAHLDYILDIGKKDNVHFIITLGNNWNDYGGVAHFTTSNDPDNFYKNSVSQTLFEKEITDVVSHTNKLNGIAYADDPMILSWEIINEPRLESDPTGQIVTNWIETMGETILQSDTHHLVSVGTEGFMIRNINAPYYENHGTDFSSVCGLSVIDMCTAHLYPKYFTAKPLDHDFDSLITTWQDISEKVNKPFYIGEVGYDRTNEPFPQNPDDQSLFFQRVKAVMVRKGISGGLMWDVAAAPNDTYSIGINDPYGMGLIQDWVK